MEAAANQKANIKVAEDSSGFAEQAVQYLIDSANQAIKASGKFYMAICGGKTPHSFFEQLGKNEKGLKMLWEKIHLFWVDEILTLPSQKGRNYQIAEETFLSKIDIPEQNVHPIPTRFCDSQASACDYEKTIRDIFKIKHGQLPQFDLVILGMDCQGTTGSLFSDSYAAFDEEDIACVVYDLEQRRNRITLTRAVLRAAKQLLILVSGEEKASILKEVLTSEPDEVRYPVHSLWPVLDKITWLVDRQAAAEIKV